MKPASLASLLFLCLLAVPPAVADTFDEARAWIEAGLEAEKRFDPAAALEHFRRAAAERPDDAFLQQKIAKQLSDAAFLETDNAVRKRLALEALGHARRSIELAPDSAVNRLSLSVLYGKLAGMSDVRTKIDYAQRIRQHAEDALALDPSYAWASHVLGRWHLEMATIGGAKRALASLLFGDIPRGSLEEGVRLLERAVELEPAALAHRIELGFAYARTGRKNAALEQWRLALQMPSVHVYDEPAKRRAREALGEFSPRTARSDQS